MLHKPTIDPAICPAPTTLAQHWIGVSLYSVDTPPPTESTVQCCMIDGQSQRRWTSIKPASGWRVVFAGHCVVDQLAADTVPLSYPANTGYSHNAVSMLAHRPRRWPNIETALGEWPVFAGILPINLSVQKGRHLQFLFTKTVNLLVYYRWQNNNKKQLWTALTVTGLDMTQLITGTLQRKNNQADHRHSMIANVPEMKTDTLIRHRHHLKCSVSVCRYKVQ